GQGAEADRLIELLDRATAIPESGPGALKSWAWAMPVKVVRGQVDDVRERLDDRMRGWEAYGGPLYEAAGAWVAATQTRGQAEGFLREMGSFAAETGSRPVEWEADLLEARWRASEGDLAAAAAAYERARAGFAAGGVPRGVAVCDLETAELKGPDALSSDER